MFVPKQIKSKFNAATRCLLLMLLSVIFTGCALTSISVSKGDFQISLPSTFSGIGKEFPKDSSLRSVTVTAKYTNDKEVPLKNLLGDNPKDADLSYIIELFPVSLEYRKISKINSKIYGFTLGLSPYPYTEFVYGYNGKHIEFGFTSYIGIDADHEANYTYTASYEEVGIIGVGCIYDDAGTKSINLWHGKAAFGAYLSGYLGDLALTYSPMIYQPYALHNGLPAGKEKKDEYTPKFYYPYLFKNYFGTSYWFSDHIKVSAGVNLYSTFEFDNLYKDFNVSFGYWF